MALKLKEDPTTTDQKNGSDYINRDYSKLADDILKKEDELPESRYSTSNTYQAINNDMRVLDAKFEMDKYSSYHYNDKSSFGYSKFDTGRTLPRLKWFMGGGNNNTADIYIGIVACVVLILMFFHRGMTSLRDMNRDTVEVEAIVTSVVHKEEYVKRGRRYGRWEDRYKTTYEWVGENGEIQSNTRTYDERMFSVGDTATVTVLANNLNEEIDSKTTAKGKVISSFCFCIGLIAFLIILIIRQKKLRE